MKSRFEFAGKAICEAWEIPSIKMKSTEIILHEALTVKKKRL